jgi:hypothetical protein
MSVVYEIIGEDLESFNCNYLNLKVSPLNLFTESLIIAIISIHLKKLSVPLRSLELIGGLFFLKIWR